ncbi:MAG: hypothetical protein K6F47_02120 [Bacteroidaceae bacterium]|nr:hypothetical protein [Bacteroidaceae bacterium]
MKKHLFSLLAMLTAFGTSAFALDQINGVYQIGTAADLKAFAELVNGGNYTANAILTADIDKGNDGTKIAQSGEYQGIFDGAGHTITINLTDTETQGPALFRSIGNRGIVQNLKVQGTIKTSKQHAAGIANYSAALIRNCFADLKFELSGLADASAAGIVGQLNRPAIIENCLSKVVITGADSHKCGGLAAWVDANRINIANCLVINDDCSFDISDGKSAGLVRDGDGKLKFVNLSTYNADSYKNRPEGANANNYITNDWGGAVNQSTTVVTAEELKSGKICYQLNSDQSHIGWVQNIGDPYPVPAVFGKDKKQVYASAATNCQGKAEGDVTFSNTPSNATVTKHTYDKYGVCTTCGQFNWNCFSFEDPTRFDPATKSVLLGNADDLYLAEGWNRLQNGFKLNMKMVNDITCTPPTGQLIFNSSDWMDSNFDGDGHAITINFVDIKENCAAFLPMFDGDFENVIMHGSISTANQYAGSIAGRFYGKNQKIRNVFSDITINTTKTGDNTSGGFVGISAANATFENCIYAGDFKGVDGTQCIAGFIGWANGNNNCLTNCAFLGTLTNAGGDSHTISRNNSQITSRNVYSLNEYNGSDGGKYVKTSAEAVANGELAYLLNGKENAIERFYQLIGTDKYPTPIAKEGALIYTAASNLRCDGKPLSDDVTYSNTLPTIPNHEFEDGVCKNCGDLETDNEGYKKIANAKSLAQFSKLVNEGKTSTKARLYEDIDMKDTEYTTAGSQANVFVGEFDGQGHAISNMTVSGADYTGLLGVIGDGAIVKNFVLDKSCSINGNAFVGAIGGTNGPGKVYITNVGNEGTVTGSAQNVSGILGCDMGGCMDMFIINCYVTGAVKGNRESAVICSWSSDKSVISNCWSIAPLEGKHGNEDSFTRGSAACYNCYEIEGVGTQNNKTGANRTNLISAENVANGKLCYIFNENAGENLLKQQIGVDAYPSFLNKMDVFYNEKLGYYNTLPLRILTGEYENTENAGVKATFEFTADVTDVTGNAIALIMEAEDYQQNGIYKAKHLFGAIAKNNDFNVTDGKLEINFTSYSGHTAQPIFEGDLERSKVGDVKADSKYVVVIYGGSLIAEGDVVKENIIESYTGAELLSLVVDEAIENVEFNDPTAINGINADKNAEIYSISGTRVNKAQKGVYIINGQKTVIK